MTFAVLLAVAEAQVSPLLKHACAAFSADPEARIEDAHQWLFHATMGGDHAIKSDETSRIWLRNKWDHLPDSPNSEPLVVRLTPDGSVLRVNLRPYKRARRDPEILFQVFVASAQAVRPVPTRFRSEWQGRGKRLRRGPIGHLTPREYRRLDREALRAGYPAIHHSKA